jgi:hypothetical protein
MGEMEASFTNIAWNLSVITDLKKLRKTNTFFYHLVCVVVSDVSE